MERTVKILHRMSPCAPVSVPAKITWQETKQKSSNTPRKIEDKNVTKTVVTVNEGMLSREVGLPNNIIVSNQFIQTVNVILPNTSRRLARLRNRNATDDGNVDFRSSQKNFYIQRLESRYKLVDLSDLSKAVK